jgi:hypothetical protein
MDGQDFYAEVLSEEERQALGVAIRLEGIEGEIALVRLLVRRCVADADLRGAKASLDALQSLLKLQLQLEESTADHAPTNLDRVLDTLAAELQ